MDANNLRDPNARASGPAVEGASSSSAGVTSTDLTSLFECPLCFEYIFPPIIQCAQGHMTCSYCCFKQKLCPTCNGKLTLVRNFVMEDLAERIKFPCKYSGLGCSALLRYDLKYDHDAMCKFRPCPCPCSGGECEWYGPLKLVVEHLKTAHTRIKSVNADDIVFMATNIDLNEAIDWVMLQSSFGSHFLLVLEKREVYVAHTQFFLVALFLGSPAEAKKFICRVELASSRRKMTWQGEPRNVIEGVDSAILEGDCLVFDYPIADYFTVNDNLSINISISKA